MIDKNFCSLWHPNIEYQMPEHIESHVQVMFKNGNLSYGEIKDFYWGYSGGVNGLIKYWRRISEVEYASRMLKDL